MSNSKLTCIPASEYFHGFNPEQHEFSLGSHIHYFFNVHLYIILPPTSRSSKRNILVVSKNFRKIKEIIRIYFDSCVRPNYATPPSTSIA